MRSPIRRIHGGRVVTLACALVFGPRIAMAEDDDAANSRARQQLQRTLVTAGSDPVDAFAIWRSEDDKSLFIKRVIMLSASIVTYLPSSDVDDDLAVRISTLALARFGLEGRPFPFLTFRSVFERNLGYALARNGPVGTSIWEGTSSLQARENYIRLQYAGFDLTGGIYRDPNTVDFVSDNVLDSFGMDPFVRDPLLLSGFSQGQGAMLRYVHSFSDDMRLTGGLSFTGGNPLTTSLAFGFGGDVSSLGTLFTAPLRALSNGIPGSDIHLLTITPSLGFESRPFSVRLAFQYFDVDPDATSEEDARLNGWNARATVEGKPPPRPTGLRRLLDSAQRTTRDPRCDDEKGRLLRGAPLFRRPRLHRGRLFRGRGVLLASFRSRRRQRSDPAVHQRRSDVLASQPARRGRPSLGAKHGEPRRRASTDPQGDGQLRFVPAPADLIGDLREHP